MKTVEKAILKANNEVEEEDMASQAQIKNIIKYIFEEQRKIRKRTLN